MQKSNSQKQTIQTKMEEKVYVQEELYNQINNTKCNVYAMHEYVTCDIDLAIDAKLIFDAKIRKLGCVEKKL